MGDLNAVSKAYGKDAQELAQKSKYRNPDEIENPKDEFRKLVPKHQQLDGCGELLNITVRRSRQSSVARATCPD